MSLVLLALIGFLTGHQVRRWAVLLVGPAAGAIVLAVAAFQQQGLWDTPAVFVAAVTTIALGAGVVVGRGRGEASIRAR